MGWGAGVGWKEDIGMIALGCGTAVGWKVDIGMNWEEEAAGCIWYDTTESLLLQQICFFLQRSEQ